MSATAKDIKYIFGIVCNLELLQNATKIITFPIIAIKKTHSRRINSAAIYFVPSCFQFQRQDARLIFHICSCHFQIVELDVSILFTVPDCMWLACYFSCNKTLQNVVLALSTLCLYSSLFHCLDKKLQSVNTSQNICFFSLVLHLELS